MYGNTLHNRPYETRFSNQVFAFLNFFNGPHFTIGDVMQCIYHIGCAGLTNIP